MVQVNENLVRALICDLEVIDRVTRNIISYVGEVKAFSWKFPNCRGDAIEPIPLIKEFSGSFEDRYVFIIELLIDRLNFFLHTLLKFLESFPLSNMTYEHCPYVSPPSFMSFGALIHSAWEKVETIYGDLMDKMEQRICHNYSVIGSALSQSTLLQKEVLEKCSQTTIVSLEQCENCHSSTKIVQGIITCIENMFSAIAQANEIGENNNPLTESAVSRIKNEVGNEIWNVSQWKVMTKIAESVAMDTNKLEVQLANYLSEKCNLSRKLNIERKEVFSLDNEKKKLMEDITTLKNNISHLLESNKNLKKMLSEKENDVKSLSDLLDELKTSNEHLRMDREELAEKLSKTQNELISVIEDLDMKSKEACIYQQKYMSELQARKKVQGGMNLARRAVGQLEEQLVEAQRNAETMALDMEGERVQFLFQIQELQGNIEQAKGEKESLVREVQELQQKNSSSLNEIQDLKSRLESMKEERLLMAKYPDFCSHTDLELIGIPEVDMGNQMKANNIRIKLLHEENSALEKTIQKVKRKRQETPV